MAEKIFEVALNEDLYGQVESVCKHIGITVDDAFNVFARRFVACGGFPFEVNAIGLEGLPKRSSLVEVEVPLPQEAYDWLKERAAEQGVTFSEYALDILRNAVDRDLLDV